MSYISRDGILKDLQEELELDSIYYNDDVNKGITEGLNMAIKHIKRFPTADVVEVVRCKDCKHCEQYPLYKEKGKESKLEYICCAFGNVSPDFYCGIGERREE